MKVFLIFIFCIVTSLQSFAQTFSPPLFYNGIDTFIIGDSKSKYIKSDSKNRLTNIQTDTLKKHIVSFFTYDRDSLIPFKIDTIEFRNMIFTFNDSTLACIDLSSIYFVKDYEKAVEYVERKMNHLKKYISSQLNKKGKAKSLINTDIYRHYGYEWTKGDYSTILTMQFDIPLSRTVSLDLYISNKKLNDYY